MSVESSRLPRVLGGVLLASLVVAACGSDSQRRNVRASEGGAPAAGAAGAAGGGAGPDLSDENGGLPATSPGEAGGPPTDVAAGAGGAPQGVAGAPRGEGGVQQPEGGAAGAGGDFVAPDCTEFEIPDFELDAAVRALADKPTGVLTPADVVNVTDVRAFGVQTLEGIECVTNLASVDLSQGGASSSLTTLSQLKYLRKLTTLDLSHADVDSYEGISDIPSLRTIRLNSDTVLDFEPFADAPKLEEINVDFGTVGDLTP
ncbi:MAG TPA: hypothetical protein VEQ59_25380, partial [Polyangiaceae bacterium]|nr:hypothetical protein [Polyangiaceae bacterium]